MLTAFELRSNAASEAAKNLHTTVKIDGLGEVRLRRLSPQLRAFVVAGGLTSEAVQAELVWVSVVNENDTPFFATEADKELGKPFVSAIAAEAKVFNGL